MNRDVDIKQIPSNSIISNDLTSCVFHVLFKILRKARLKHRLSIDCLLVLNAAYLYNKYKGQSFTETQLKLFVTYYNEKGLRKYFRVLFYRGFIVQCGYYNKIYPIYKISSLGIECISIIHDDYPIVLNSFVSDNGL